jgi:hypothetical protein
MYKKFVHQVGHWVKEEKCDELNEMTMRRAREKEESGNEEKAGRTEKKERWRCSYSR